MNKVELSIRDQLEILSYRGSDKDILDIQKEVRQDWLKYLTRKKWIENKEEYSKVKSVVELYSMVKDWITEHNNN